MRAILFVLAWSTLTAPVFAQTAEPDFYIIKATGTREAPTSIVLADTAHVTENEDGYRRLRSWSYFTRESSPQVRSMMIEIEIDCPQARFRIVGITRREWSSEPVTYTRVHEWADVTPGTNSATLQLLGRSTQETIATGGFGHLGNVDPDVAAAIALHLDPNG